MKIKQSAASSGEKISGISLLKVTFDFRQSFFKKFIIKSHILAIACFLIKLPTKFIKRFFVSLTQRAKIFQQLFDLNEA